MTNWLCLAAQISLALNFQELLLALTTLKSAFLCFGETRYQQFGGLPVMERLVGLCVRWFFLSGPQIMHWSLWVRSRKSGQRVQPCTIPSENNV